MLQGLLEMLTQLFYPLSGSVPRHTHLPLFYALVAVRTIPELPQLLSSLGVQHRLHRLFDGLPAPIGPGLGLAHQDLVGHLGDRPVVTHGALLFLAETFHPGTWNKPSANFAPGEPSEVPKWGFASCPRSRAAPLWRSLLSSL